MTESTTTPTVGRRVYFWPAKLRDFNCLDNGQPFDAGVVFVDQSGTVNLSVTDHAGVHHALRNVPFGDFDRPDLTPAERDAIEDAGGFADWMHYEKGRQSVTEA